MVVYNGKRYKWDDVFQHMDGQLVDYIRSRYKGSLTKQRLLDEYIALAGWFFVLKPCRGKVVDEK